jgi:hypothetical protein
VRAVEAAGRNLGVLLNNLWVAFDPMCIVIGGAALRLGRALHRPRPQRARLRQRHRAAGATIRTPHFGDNAIAIGGAAMARHYLMRPFVGQIPRAAAATSWARPPPALVAGAWAWNRKTKGRTFAGRPLHRWQPGLPTYIRLLQFDFDINASWQVQLHQCVNGLVGWVDDVHQALVGADFELVARGLVDVRRTQNVETLDAGWQGTGPLTTAPVRLAVSTISRADWSISL